MDAARHDKKIHQRVRREHRVDSERTDLFGLELFDGLEDDVTDDG